MDLTACTVLVYRIQCTVYHTPLGRFSKRDCLTTKRVPIPTETSSENSRGDMSNAAFFGTASIPAKLWRNGQWNIGISEYRNMIL